VDAIQFLPSCHCDFTIVTTWLLLNEDASWNKQSAIGRLFGADNRPADNRPKHYRRTSTSLVLTSGRPTVQTWIPSTTRSGASCSSRCMNHESTASISWSNVSTTSGMACSSTSLTWLAASQWRQRLTLCVCAHGRHFEHLLWACITQTWVESQYVRINYCWTLFIKITKGSLHAKSTNF